MKYFLYCRKSTESEERQVLSLQSQREALDRAFSDRSDIEIVGVFEESKSAKTPGRPVFNMMVQRLEAGEAEGILTWAPDRLARNSIDGGRIVYLLDTGVIHDLKFATYTFENNSQGKFMLSIMFGQSKYYSDALSENVKRGNRTKIANGWRPNRAPVGYLNDPASKTIVPDPALFTLIRRMFEMILYEGKSPNEVAYIANSEWGLLTPAGKKSGKAPISRSAVYSALRNPFYMGEFDWDGERYEGRHDPMITRLEFNKLQQLLGEKQAPPLRSRSFAFTGLMCCGKCGKAVTAERKQKRSGLTYIYYHCAGRGKLRGECVEPSVEERPLDLAIREFLGTLYIEKEVADWARGELRREGSHAASLRASADRARHTALREISSQLTELTSLRLRKLISDEEFTETKGHLQARRDAIEDTPPTPDAADLIEPLENVILASNHAAEWFSMASNAGKREVLKIVGSNPTLTDKKLSIQAAKPFFENLDFGKCPSQLGDVDQDRTRSPVVERGRRLLKAVESAVARTEDHDRLAKLKTLVDRFRSNPTQVVSRAA